jgi:serine-type D-Ala-D-Ala endopeptidase (penicillin-binding protein 7)
MRITEAGRAATLVLLNAGGNSARLMDALNIRRLLAGDNAPQVMKASSPRKKAVRTTERRRRRM